MRLENDQRVGQLSKGERGKLLILLALAQKPDLLVLDEPTDGLDPVVRRDVLTAVLDYVSVAGATVFISSHLVHELECASARVSPLRFREAWSPSAYACRTSSLIVGCTISLILFSRPMSTGVAMPSSKISCAARITRSF